ncbi:MAG: hypothetical protein ABRQ25_16555 [Clostridiaceae bacterium]
MKLKTICFIYLFYFAIFLLNAEYIGYADWALGCHLVLLSAFLLYCGITGITKTKFIPMSNIIIWICLVLLNIPLIMILINAGIINTSRGAFGLGEGELEYLFYIPMNMLFSLGLIIENIIMYLIFKIKK